MLDIALARYVGLDPENQGAAERVATAGGIISLWRMTVDMDVIGQRVSVHAQFGRKAAPLLGRQGLFQAVEQAGFTSQDWLQQFYRSSPPVGVSRGSGSTATTRRREYDPEIDPGKGLGNVVCQSGMTSQEAGTSVEVVGLGEPERTALLSNLGVEEADRQSARVRVYEDFVLIDGLRFPRQKLPTSKS